jgi:hypothetical protein
MRLHHLILLTVLLAPLAAADVLVLRDGSMVTGTVVSTGEDSVTMRLTDGGTATYDAQLIEPRSFVSVRASSLGDHQVEELLTLSGYAALHGLFATARDLLTRVEGQAEGRDDAFLQRLAQRRRSLREAEAAALLADATARRDGGELEKALELTRRILESFPDTPTLEPAQQLAEEVLAAQRQAQEDAAASAAEAVRRQGEASRARALARGEELFLRATHHKENAQEQGALCRKHATTSGNRSRMRRHLTTAEKEYGRSLRYLAHVPDTLAGLTSPEATQLLERTAAGERFIEDALVSLYTQVARIYVEERNYREASDLVQKGMTLRPNDPTLRELDETIAENWKRRSAADRSNARPIINNR